MYTNAFYQPIAYKQSHYTCIVFALTFSHTLFWLELLQCPFIWNVVMTLYLSNFSFFLHFTFEGDKVFFVLPVPYCSKFTVAEKCKTNHDSENKITNYKRKCKYKTTLQFRKHWQTGKGGCSLRRRHWFGNRLLTADWTRHLSIKMYRKSQK